MSLLLGLACATTSPAPPTSAPAPASPTPAAASAPEPAPGTGNVPFVYVSGYRPEILIFRLDVAGARLVPAGSADGGKEPSFLAVDKDARYLFAANEVDEGAVVAFSIDSATGALTRINQASSGGFGPAHLSVDRSGRWVLAANYADPRPGTIAVLPIGPGGRLGEPVDRHDFGPATMPHFISTDPSNRSVYVPCKGGPYVAQLRFDAATGQIEPGTPDRVPSAPGSGPRHLDFHPNRRFAYVINELAFTITTYAFDEAAGRLTEIETVPTLPASVTDRKGFSTADIHVHPSGKWLYGSNRGYNSIVQYAIDAGTGKLTLVGHERATIKKPRNFHIDPSGQLLLVANQEGASVSVFRIDAGTGKLSLAGEPTPAGKNPSYVGVVMLKGA